MTGYIAAGVILLLIALYFASGYAFYNVSVNCRTKRFFKKKPKKKKPEQESLLLPINEYNEKINAWGKLFTEIWQRKSHDGLNLVAHYYEAEKSHLWALVVHGYTSQGLHMPEFSYEYAQRGFNVLAPDCRGHGGSEGKYIGMGWHDRLDIIGWIQLIIEHDPEAEILLTGCSMGGATVMMTAGENLPEQVKCVVEDCGYTSAYDEFAYQLKRMFHLPRFPFMSASNLVCQMRAGYGFKDASAINQVKKNRLPMLFIHGGKDDFVPTKMVYELYDAAVCEKQLLVVDNAVHGNAVTTDPISYWNTVEDFIYKYLNLKTVS